MVTAETVNKNKKYEVNKNKNKKYEVNNKHNNKNKSEVKETKNKPEITKNNNKNVPVEDDKGPLDEKGNPFPIKNPEGGDPICPGGYKIDYQFDPINDPINPMFRCIPALTDPTDGIAGKMLAMANNPSSGVENIAAMGNLPGVGGKRGRRGRNPTTRGTKRRSSARRTRRRCRQTTTTTT